MTALYFSTPLLISRPLSRFLGKDIYLKYESFQQSGSFKDRGIGTLCAHLARQGAKGFISSSGGNAGLAVAFISKALRLPATIVIPKTTPRIMVDKLETEGATVIVHGENWDEADAFAKEKAEQEKLAYVPPFDHPKIWEGYVSLVEEFERANFKPDAILLSVGGGGLYSGIVQGCHKVGWLDVPIITAETSGAASFAKSFQEKKRIRLESVDTVATSLAAKQICQQAFDWSQKHPTMPQVVSDKQAISACLRFADEHLQMIEPAGGASMAVLYERYPVIEPYEKIAVILCGGNGVSLDLLQEWKTQFDL